MGVSAGGAANSGTLISKTGSLNIAATANDPESGVQALEIWVSKKTTSCDANGICSTSGPGLLGQPRFQSTSPKKNPGEVTSAASTLLDVLNLSTEIPQGTISAGSSRAVDIIIQAVATNHLGGKAQTPSLTLTWSEP